jgi:aspartate aminotransferase-like enzyme
MLNFTVGPVMMSEEIRKIGYNQIPYFRTNEFSQIMLENERLLLEFFKAPSQSRIAFITGSGTASMEAVVMNTLTKKDKALVVNGGSFGERFCQICSIHNIPYEEIDCERGKTLTADQLTPFEGKDFTAFLVNLDETSTGVLYDIHLISEFCKRNHLFLIVDSISSFLCDPFDMTALGVNVVITGSQKALAVAPGISVICMDELTQNRISENEVPSLYFDLKSYLKNGERGQTPFTPAVGILLQLNQRLNTIKQAGGVDSEVNRTQKLATYFRSRITKFPFRFFADKMSNAVTALACTDERVSAYKIFEILKDEYGIFICPNGGDLKNKVFRVGHIGDLTYAEYDQLLQAFEDLKKRKII